MEAIHEKNLVGIEESENKIDVAGKIMEDIIATSGATEIDFNDVLNNPEEYTPEIVVQADKNREEAIIARDVAIAKIKELMKNKKSRIVQI